MDVSVRASGPTLGEVCDEVLDAIEYCKNKYYAFTAASIALNHLEALGSCLLVYRADYDLSRRNYNCQRFKAFVKRYFPVAYGDPALLEVLWKRIRCTLDHMGTVAPGIVVSCNPEKQCLHLQTVTVVPSGNPALFVHIGRLASDMKAAISLYLSALRSDSELARRASDRMEKGLDLPPGQAWVDGTSPGEAAEQ